MVEWPAVDVAFVIAGTVVKSPGVLSIIAAAAAATRAAVAPAIAVARNRFFLAGGEYSRLLT